MNKYSSLAAFVEMMRKCTREGNKEIRLQRNKMPELMADICGLLTEHDDYTTKYIKLLEDVNSNLSNITITASGGNFR